ncbi:hypothetical protein [Pseudomonas sp. PS01297]|uniref:hypothetical protein n=1 Tax=Pseudomonas sp. PS01297 TaxID=2991433 RepID=UPI00249CC6E1|nr:hypothetical protein [Pseudomonas sp. PS01297]
MVGSAVGAVSPTTRPSVFGLFVGRLVGLTEGSAGGNELVGVAIEAADHQFLADARYNHGAL